MNTFDVAKQIESRAIVHVEIMSRDNEGMTVADAATFILPIVSLARTIALAKAHGKAGPGNKASDPIEAPPTRPADAYVALINAGGLVLASAIKAHVGDRIKRTTCTPDGTIAKRDVLSLSALCRAMARQVLNGKSTIDILDLTESLIEGKAKHHELLSEVERGILIAAYLTVAAERVPT